MVLVLAEAGTRAILTDEARVSGVELQPRLVVRCLRVLGSERLLWWAGVRAYSASSRVVMLSASKWSPSRRTGRWIKEKIGKSRMRGPRTYRLFTAAPSCAGAEERSARVHRSNMFSSRRFDGNKCKVQLKMLINRCAHLQHCPF